MDTSALERMKAAATKKEFSTSEFPTSDYDPALSVEPEVIEVPRREDPIDVQILKELKEIRRILLGLPLE